MILKAKERGNAPQLAQYLMSMRDNEHVELHDLRGFVSDDLAEAFLEAEAISKGTKCQNHLFSMSLNPPVDQNVSREDFERAVDQIESKLGLDDHARAIVFHEKEGRRHAHAVWSRIDSETMRAKNMSFYKQKLMDVSRDLYLEHGWEMPKGMIDRSVRNPLNYSRAEWQQANRSKQDPKMIKAAFQECWKNSDGTDGCCQTDANQSLLWQDGCPLRRAKLTPLGKSDGPVELENGTRVEVAFLIEMVMD